MKFQLQRSSFAGHFQIKETIILQIHVIYITEFIKHVTTTQMHIQVLLNYHFELCF
jgi:hypothetical protein